MELLYKKMHALEPNEIGEIKSIADTIFEPLIRPFRQKRSVSEFDYRKTIKMAQKIGHLMPCYSRTEREHRKSKLVIAMSLSGVDRCAAVSLIPLFAELKKFLDFKLFIYTNDIVEAKFTEDGFLANDHEICWNNVVAPMVFYKLSQMEFSKQEDTLLLIDSLGGGDSEWFWYWNNEKNEEIRSEQKKYLVPEGNWGGYWSKLRNLLGGDYDKIKTLSKKDIPQAWAKTVARNTSERWVDAPALQEYLVRWLFNPEFGSANHDSSTPYYLNGQYIGNSSRIGDFTHLLSNKFKRIHLLSPAYNESTEETLKRLLRLNFIDYHHKADTINGLANVLSNIVHGKCTDRLTYDKPIFSTFIDDEIEIETEEDDNHNELTVSNKSCFEDCVAPDKIFPEKTTFSVPIKKRGMDHLSYNEIPYNKCDVAEWIPRDSEWDIVRHSSFESIPDLTIDPSSSKFTQFEEAKKFLTQVKNCEIRANKYRDNTFSLCQREGKEISLEPNYLDHRTRALKPHVDEVLKLFSPQYQEYIEELPLQNVVWCNRGNFCAQKLSIGIPPEEKSSWEKVIFHEVGHYLEHVCPQVGAFTNGLIRYKVDGIKKGKLIDLAPGEKAMPVTNGTTPWIKPYAGKWYPREHKDLPNATEILSVYLEYFSSYESLLKLAKHDLHMTKFIAFILMGGPIAAFNATQFAKETKILNQIEQKSRPSRGYRRGRPSGSGSGRTKTPKTNTKRFGV
jgi:hypothetical protein